jgi:glycosyltransferase involved in cell wall biosynthesis
MAVVHHHKHYLYETCMMYKRVGAFGGFITKRFVRNSFIPNTLKSFPISKLKKFGGTLSSYQCSEIEDDVFVFADNLKQKLALKAMGMTRFLEGSDFYDATIQFIRREGYGVHSHVTGSQELFEALKPEGRPCMLEMYLGAHRRGRDMLIEELEDLGLPALDATLATYGLSMRNVDRSEAECELADHIFCPSPFVADSVADTGIDRSKIVLAPYGASRTLTQDQIRSTVVSQRNPDEALRVGFVGTEGVRKGLRYLVEAVDRATFPIELHVFGLAGFDLPQYANQLKKVTFWGHLPKDMLLHQVSQLHAGCLPSLYEGSALGVFDFLSCGVPVVVTPNAGTVITHDEQGLIVPVRDSDALLQAFEQFHGDEERRQQMGHAGLSVAGVYTWDRYRQCLYERLEPLLLKD